MLAVRGITNKAELEMYRSLGVQLQVWAKPEPGIEQEPVAVVPLLSSDGHELLTRLTLMYGAALRAGIARGEMISPESLTMVEGLGRAAIEFVFYELGLVDPPEIPQGV